MGELGYLVSMGDSALNISQLSVVERLDLIGELWDSIPNADVPLGEEERAILDVRLDALDAKGSVGIPWTELKARWEQERDAK